MAGKRYEVDAKEIIHIYRKEFPQQTRGIPPFNAVLNDIKQLEDYKEAELMAAKAAACLAIFYERNQNAVQGRFDVEESETKKGEFLKDLAPGIASVVPTGYGVKTVSPTHPSSGFEQFTKAVLKQIASSLGVSYAKMIKDYEAVNYSSLRVWYFLPEHFFCAGLHLDEAADTADFLLQGLRLHQIPADTSAL